MFLSFLTYPVINHALLNTKSYIFPGPGLGPFFLYRKTFLLKLYGSERRKIRLIEGNAKCCHLKKIDLYRDFAVGDKNMPQYF